MNKKYIIINTLQLVATGLTSFAIGSFFSANNLIIEVYLLMVLLTLYLERKSLTKYPDAFLWFWHYSIKINNYIQSKTPYITKKNNNNKIIQYMDLTKKMFFENKLHNEKDLAVIYPLQSNKECEYWLYGEQMFPKDHSDFLILVIQKKNAMLIKDKIKEF